MNELIEKIVAELNASGIELKKNLQNGYDNYDFATMYKSKGIKWIRVMEVYRHNGTEKNVNAEISFYETIGCCYSKKIDKVRVNENASDRVIKNRVKKILEVYTNDNK